MAQYISQTMTTSNPRVNYRIVVTTKSQSIENNSTTMNVQVQAWRNNSGYTTSGSGRCYCKIQGIEYSDAVYDSQKITEYSYTVLFTRDVTVAHNNDGSCTLSLSAKIDHYAFSTSEQSYSTALPTIPRASQPSLSTTEFNIGEELEIYTNRVSTAFTHNIYFITADGEYEEIATDIKDSFIWKDTSRLYEECPNNPNFSSCIAVRTYSSGTLIGEEKQAHFTATVTNSEPVCGEVNYFQTNPAICALLQNSVDIIVGRSTLLVTFAPCEAKNFSSINKYCIQIGNKIYESETAQFSIYDFPQAEAMVCWVKDSRGFETLEQERVRVDFGTFYDYSPPVIKNIQLNRENDVYENTFLSFTAEVANIIADNTAFAITLRTKESGSSAFSPHLDIVKYDSSNSTYSFNASIGDFEIGKSYDIELTIEDCLDINSYTAFLPSSRPELSIRNNMVGINCIPVADNGTLQIDGKNLLDLLHPVGSLYMSTDGISPETLFGGKWESIKDRFLLCAGDTYTAGTTGGAATVTLQVEHMPSHDHTLSKLIGGTGGINSDGQTVQKGYYGDSGSNLTSNYPNNYSISNTGGGQAHNNMPPYLTVYCWKRVE